MSDTPQLYNYYDSKYVAPKFGLSNTGAICWFNSLLQVMLGLPSLNKVILECEESLIGNRFAQAYITVLKNTIANDSPPDLAKLAWSSSAVIGALVLRAREKHIRVNLGRGQECADEGFVTFIELLECPRAERLFSNVYELSITCQGCQKKVSTVRDKSYRVQMFTRVPLETKERFCTFLRIHPSECDYYKCECGNVMTKFYREEKLKMLREIVIIMFNKFVTKDVRWFPQDLTFKGRDGKNLSYRLVGKIEHAGTRVSGHYWAHSLRHEEWVCLNDTSVSIGSPMPTANTFMVAYHLVEDNTDSVANTEINGGAIV